MPDGETPESPAPARRRVDEPVKPGTEGRAGCLAWGGVLGVLVGIMVGLYALPPILKSIYGVEQVAAGETFEDGGRSLRVIGVTEIDREPAGAVEVVLAIEVDEAWTLPAGNWSLELATGERIDLVGAPPAGFVAEAGSPTEFALTFARLPGLDAEPRYLHLSSPRVRFDLEGIAAP